MPKFEDMMKKMSEMSGKKQNELIEKNKEICICSGCPTYTGTLESELLFCATSRSEKIKKEKGCICPDCPMTSMMGLRWDYYCTKGTGMQQLTKSKK